MRKLLFLSVALLGMSWLLISCGDEEDQYGSGSVKTGDASKITYKSAVLSGSYNSDSILEVGFHFSEDNDFSIVKGYKSYDVDGSGKFSVTVDYLDQNTTYYYRAYLNDGYELHYGDVKKFSTKSFEFAAIDIGLSVKWANANIGADTPNEPGDHYAWGETEVKDEYTFANYKWCSDDYGWNLTKYNDNNNYGYVDKKTVLEKKDDVANVKLGSRWRIPTPADFNELLATVNKSDYKWEKIRENKYEGWEVTYLVNGNSLFIPCTGIDVIVDGFTGGILEYWSSSLSTVNPQLAKGLFEKGNSLALVDSGPYRSSGISVRAVME